MARLRRNEWNFAANAAQIISGFLAAEEFSSSPLGHAESELSELRGAKRLDLVLFKRQTPAEPLITGELKVPWDILGRTPYNSKLVNDAHSKASRAGALYFITWNIRRVVLWKTDDPGVALMDRVVYDKEVIPSSIGMETAADLDKSEVRDALSDGISQLLRFLETTLTGPPTPTFLPLDKLFIAKLESALDFPIQKTISAIKSKIGSSSAFKTAIEKWMREAQGWVVTEATQNQNIDHAARFTCYVLVNRFCFYDALRRKYRNLPRLSVSNSIATGAALRRRLAASFNDAKRYTGNYETVFEGDFGDTLPFLSDEAVPEWRNLIRSLDRYDFANISLDVIGAMYEQLIKPAERHRYGQHYTQPAVVDLITSFAIQSGRQQVFDPGCGGGTFLVRSYARKVYLDPTQDHSELLENIYGCDILNYACHLSIINLAIRDLIDDDNFPRIHLGDFLKYRPGELFNEQPVRIQAGGLVTEKREIVLTGRTCDAIIGNPPYISAREMRQGDRSFYHQHAMRFWPSYPWRKAADIYTYFWLHGERFLKASGILALLTQAAWLDVDYGIPLQKWMLDHFKIVAILETEAEPWFTDARVATAVTVLQREENAAARSVNRVKFVQFRSRLLSIIGNQTSEQDREQAFEILRDRLLAIEEDANQTDFRVRTISQNDLELSGQNDDGEYIGSKWGRYLRSTDTLYALQKTYANNFVSLKTLAEVKRGTTTNCDDFFIVTDVSQESLSILFDARDFRTRFNVERHRVTSGDVKIVRRKDGVELALESRHLRRIIKTARDVHFFSTSRIETDFIVLILDQRNNLSRLARAYVERGELEGWHRAPSFEAIQEQGGNWYALREAEPAPILLIKTMQYSPLVLFNDANLIANQRLYTLRPVNGIDPLALCAILNSTPFVCERYAAVKALGREAAIDVEVFSANAYRTPDLRRAPAQIIEQLSDAMHQLCGREAGPMVEEALLNLDISGAKAYASRHPINRRIWPAEFSDSTREEIDRIVFRLIGVSELDISDVRERMINELISHTRKLRILELEAQVNRQGVSNKVGPSARQLADAIWAQLLREGLLRLRRIPSDFLPESLPVRPLHLPTSGRMSIEQPALFDTQRRFVVRIGRETLEFETLDETSYAVLLSEFGIAGEVSIPIEAENCTRIANEIREYGRQFSEVFRSAAAEITSDTEFQRRIVREGWKVIIHQN
jgi:hypothetical protein